MFFHTDTADAPWTVIKSDCKKRARLHAMRYVLHSLPYEKKDASRIGPVDTLLVGRAHIVYERGEQVKITDGPFKEFTGTVEDINLERSTLRVLVTIFGRPTPVELEFVQVQKL